ncbi:glutaminase [Nocardioides ungokensis]|uniref:glutaminase n=1 Tax=Nocardioides ungokensis TaxID=1643322 RepID=UPI0015DF625A|nr:glutaminase [Nocardioides ungokensis]
MPRGSSWATSPARTGPPTATTGPSRLTCGTYDSAGELAYRVGLSAKSGVGGGILAVIPDRGVGCVWSPTLVASGSSAAGLAALDAFTTYSDWTVV